MTDFAGAEKKLRQTKFFLAHLENPIREMVRNTHDPKPLEFYFSACLTVAKSVYYVLQKTSGARLGEVQCRWPSELQNPDLSLFDGMMGLHDHDIHQAKTDAEPLNKYVIAKPNPHAASIGGNDAVVEMQNPDGTKVSGPVLRGTVGLYIGMQGRKIEATDSCRQFIEQLSSLLNDMTAVDRRDETGGSKV